MERLSTPRTSIYDRALTRDRGAGPDRRLRGGLAPRPGDCVQGVAEPRRSSTTTTKAWSGDHCIEPELVPGVIISNRAFSKERPSIADLAPSRSSSSSASARRGTWTERAWCPRGEADVPHRRRARARRVLPLAERQGAEARRPRHRRLRPRPREEVRGRGSPPEPRRADGRRSVPPARDEHAAAEPRRLVRLHHRTRVRPSRDLRLRASDSGRPGARICRRRAQKAPRWCSSGGGSFRSGRGRSSCSGRSARSGTCSRTPACPR